MCSAAKVRANAAIGLRIRTPVGRRGSDGSTWMARFKVRAVQIGAKATMAGAYPVGCPRQSGAGLEW